MSKRCVIISGGEFFSIDKVSSDDFVIACDKGYEYARRSGIVPDLLVGDFDSYDGNVCDGVRVQKYKKEKDDTDTMIAFRFAVENGFDEIYMYCALGGRLDHTFANLQSAAYAVKNGVFVKITDSVTELYFISHSKLRITEKKGFSLSLFSVTDKCTDVSISGAKYPLHGATLTNTYPIGVSNEWENGFADVSVGEGILMIMLSKLI